MKIYKGTLTKKTPEVFTKGMYVMIDDIACHLFQIYDRKILGATIGQSKFHFMSADIDSHYMKTFDEDQLASADLKVLILKYEDCSEIELEFDYWITAIEADLIDKEIEFKIKKGIAYPVVENPLWEKELNYYLQHDDESTPRKFKEYMEQHYKLVKKFY